MTKREWLSACLHDPKASVRSETALILDRAGRRLLRLADQIEFGR